MINFANIDSATEIIKQLYPNNKEIRFIEHGYDNLVCLIEDKYAIKFPRSEFAYIRDKYEKIILEDLSSLQNIAIPKVLGDGDNPPYLITSFVSGESLSEDEINQLPQKLQNNFAEKLAEFAFSMHSLLSVKKATEDRVTVKMDDFDYYDYALKDFQFPTPEQDKIAQNYYTSWKNLEYDHPKVVVHNDLNSMNLLFKENQLVGIIDFGDARIGYAEQELRQLYRINNSLLESAVGCYEKLSGYKLDIEAIKINAVVQELAAYANKLPTNNTTHPGFIRAKKHLEQWFPECNWETN
jgi:aminoglycoside phosphotransferase (APT) family kinase protein